MATWTLGRALYTTCSYTFVHTEAQPAHATLSEPSRSTRAKRLEENGHSGGSTEWDIPGLDSSADDTTGRDRGGT